MNISGRSLHSWAGIELGKEDVPILLNRIKRTEERVKRWQQVAILIIDESKLTGFLSTLPYCPS